MSRRQQRRWSNSEVARLRRQWHDGRTSASIARTLGRTRKSVERKRHDLGLVDRKPWRALRLRQEITRRDGDDYGK